MPEWLYERCFLCGWDQNGNVYK